MICAIDCDLRESFCVTDTGLFGRGATPFIAMEYLSSGPRPDTVLFEIASPVSFNRQDGGQAAVTQLAKWAIWNTSFATHLSLFHTTRFIRFLVAPSNVWTHGYDLKTRHTMAKAKLKKKDLRECEAMLFFYKHSPKDWLPLPEYLANL